VVNKNDGFKRREAQLDKDHFPLTATVAIGAPLAITGFAFEGFFDIGRDHPNCPG
jgi:hypothetical protein